MPKLLFRNSASATLATPLTLTGSSLVVTAGTGSRFPQPATNEHFYATLVGASGTHEIVRVSARTGDIMTVQRGQDATAAQSWASGTRVELRVTAAVLDAYLQRTGGVMSGILDMGGFEIKNPKFNTLDAQVLRCSYLRDLTGNTDYDFQFRPGQLPLLGTSIPVTRKELRYLCFPWGGNESSIALPWTLCDGSNGTPDLRDRFIKAAGPRYGHGYLYPDEVPPSIIQSTFLAGDHNHAGDTGSTVLTTDQMPKHRHDITGLQTSSNNTGSFLAATAGATVADKVTDYEGGGKGHTHTIKSDGEHRHVMPVAIHYVLAFVMYHPSYLA